MPPAVVAHRGASGTRPENTLAAFRRAAEVGAPMIELDVQLTRDGVVVVLHDDRLERTTDGRGAVSDRRWNEIARLDAGSWFAPAFAGERVPRLTEVLASVPLALNVELKPGPDDGLELRTLDVIREQQALQRVVLSSFDAARLARLRTLEPAADLAVLWGRRRVSGALELADRVGARALHIRNGPGVHEGIAAAHASGRVARVWTVNCQAEFSRLGDAGADAVFTDFPERFLHTGEP